MAVTMSPPSPAASDGSTNSADTAPPRTPPGQAQLPLPMPVDSTASNASNTGTANGNSSSGSTTPSATGANSANQGGVKRTTKASRRANTAERRATHNAVERARRETLNGRFLDLAALLPNLSQIRRPSKSAIVNSSIAHVSASRRHRILASQQLRTLKAECDALRSEANEWRVRAGIPRVEEPRRGEGFSVVLSGELEFEAGDLDLVAAEDMEDEDELSPGPGYDEQQQQQQQQLIQLQQQQQQQLAAQQAQQAAAAQQVTITIPSAHPGGRQSHSPPHYASPPLSAGGMHSPSHYSGGTHSPPHYHPHPHHPYVTSPHADFVVPSSISAAAAAAAAGGSPHADFVTPEYAAAVGSPMIASPVFEYDPSRVGPSGVGPYEFDYSGGAGAGASGGAGGQGQALHHQQIMIQQRAEQVQVDGGKWEGGMYGHGHGHGHGHGQVVGVW